MTDFTELSEAMEQAYDQYRSASDHLQTMALHVARQVASATWPNSHSLIVSSSDQADRGFVLDAVLDAEGDTITDDDDEYPDLLVQVLTDIEWDNPEADRDVIYVNPEEGS
ncbi:MAG: hypothetical protein ACXVYY_01130 [Oryzihumus sp.]